jgi:pilus assembly protein CpaC
VLSDGRISMRVRPEVSELSNEGAIKINGFDVPGISTRRAETTIELGSGQSFMIGGLMRSLTSNAITKAPGVGDLPVLGALFRSNSFRRNDTELMIIVTPYLVKPVSADQIKLPTDGYLAPTDAERLLLGKAFEGKTGQQRPMPSVAPDTNIVRPSVGMAPPVVPAPAARPGKTPANAGGGARPGFSN